MGEVRHLSSARSVRAHAADHELTLRAEPAAGEYLDTVDRGRLEKFIAGQRELREQLKEIGLEPKAISNLFTRAKKLLHDDKFPTT